MRALAQKRPYTIYTRGRPMRALTQKRPYTVYTGGRSMRALTQKRPYNASVIGRIGWPRNNDVSCDRFGSTHNVSAIRAVNSVVERPVDT